jgi:hypothetical protein
LPNESKNVAKETLTHAKDTRPIKVSNESKKHCTVSKTKCSESRRNTWGKQKCERKAKILNESKNVN